MKSLGWPLPNVTNVFMKGKRGAHRHTHGEDHEETLGEGTHPEIRKRGLRIKQFHQHLHLFNYPSCDALL